VFAICSKLRPRWSETSLRLWLQPETTSHALITFLCLLWPSCPLYYSCFLCYSYALSYSCLCLEPPFFHCELNYCFDDLQIGFPILTWSITKRLFLPSLTPSVTSLPKLRCNPIFLGEGWWPMRSPVGRQTGENNGYGGGGGPSCWNYSCRGCGNPES
jgi:hypothetical protein